MNEPSEYNTDHIGMIALCLANSYLKPLYERYAHKSYYVYAECLEIIIDWAFEFYAQHYTRMRGREPAGSSDDSYLTQSQKAFLLQWANERLSGISYMKDAIPEKFHWQNDRGLDGMEFFDQLS